MSLPPISHSDWITPEEQLRQLAVAPARDLIYANKKLREELPVALPLMRALLYPSDEMRELLHSQGEDLPVIPMENKIAESAINTMQISEGFFHPIMLSLGRRKVSWRNGGSETQIPSLMDLTVEKILYPSTVDRILNPSPLPPILTDWYTALKRLNLLSLRIPPLPRNIREILDSPCPLPKKKGEELRLDGTFYGVPEGHPRGIPWKISETHLLYLVPAGTANELERKVNAYGQEALDHIYGEERLYPYGNPLRFSSFPNDAAREVLGNVPFEAEWILISKAVLEGSQGLRLPRQIEIIQRVSARALAPYQIPTIKQAFACAVLHKIATEETLYPRYYSEGGNERSTYTRVQEMIPDPFHIQGMEPVDSHFFLGDFTSSGVYVGSWGEGSIAGLGVTALRKL